MPWLSSTPYFAAIAFVVSATRGICMNPSPPLLRGVRHQARWHSSVSVEMATTRQLRASNSFARSEKATSSVGHTKVKSCGRGERPFRAQPSLSA